MNATPSTPLLAITPDDDAPRRYADASGDFNPIHTDAAHARSIGLPRNILHGLYVMALVAEGVGTLAPGDPLALRSLHVQFRHPAFPGEEILVRAAAQPVADRLAVDVEAVQGGRAVVRHGRAELRRRVADT